MPLPEADIVVGATYEGRGWKTARKIVDRKDYGIKTVKWTSVGGRPRQTRWKELDNFAAEATRRVDREAVDG